jgi:hypothetical protein
MNSPYFTPGAPAGGGPEDQAHDDAARQAAAAAGEELRRQAEASPGVAPEAAAVASQLTGRGPALPAEAQYDELMAAFKAQAAQIEALAGRVGTLQRAADERAVELGGPPVVRYAQAVADRLAATAVAHPDLGAEHFAHPLAAAGQLVDQAKALHGQEVSDPAAVHNAAERLERWITRTHPRTSGKHLETLAAVADDLDQVRDEADKLAA